MVKSKVVSGSSEIQGKLWGARPQDWADVLEPNEAALFEAVFDRLDVGAKTHLLDVGSGAGYAVALAARRGAKVAGLDAAAPLIDIARTRVPDGDFRVGELEDLPYGDATFDLVTGFNSFQYATRPVEAVREAARVTKPGGTVVAAVWGQPEDNDAAGYIKALGSQLPAPPPGAPGPWALSPEGALEALLAEAGLTAFASGDVPTPWRFPDLETALRGMLAAGPSIRAIEHSGEDAVREAVARSLEPYRQPDGSYALNNSFRYVAARV